jgi:hypothetical protein
VPGSEISRFRAELKGMKKAGILKMVFGQREKECLLGGTCPFLLEYKRLLFCVSEIIGQGCQIEKLKISSREEARSEGEASPAPFPLSASPCLPGFRQTDLNAARRVKRPT